MFAFLFLHKWELFGGPSLPRYLAYGALEICIGVLLVGLLASTNWSGIISAEPLAWFGRHCYGLYIWHMLVGRIVADAMPGPVFAKVVTWLALTCAVAAMSFRYFESPFLRMKPVRRPRVAGFSSS